MKEIRLTLVILSTIAFLYACSNDTHQFSSNIEQVLPGKWRIESVYLPAINEGITYQGKTFYRDTTLFEIGEMEFSSFQFYSGLDFPVSTNVNGNLKIEDENFPFIINNLIIDVSIHGFLSLDLPEGVDTIDTPGEEFVWSSRIFNANYRVLVDGDHHVQLESYKNHVIDLEKIE
jgi:hypothetical protein